MFGFLLLPWILGWYIERSGVCLGLFPVFGDNRKYNTQIFLSLVFFFLLSRNPNGGFVAAFFFFPLIV